MIPSAPAPEAVLFRSSTGRAVVLHTGSAVFVWLCVAGFYIGLTALLGGPVGRTAGYWLSPWGLAPAVGAFVVLLAMMIRSPHWVRVSASGLEIGTTRARAVLIPWSGVESATVRGRSVLATLDVVPQPSAPIALQDGHARRPRMRTRGGRRGYPVMAGLFPGGPAAVTSALRAHAIPAAPTSAPSPARP